MIILIILLGFFLRILNLRQSFWLDEAAQMIESIRPLSDQLHIRADFQPPLYHILLHFWIQYSNSEIWARMLSVLFGVMSILVSYKLLQLIIPKKAALLSAFLFALNPFHIWYSQEVRPYALATLLGIMSTYMLIKKNFGGYIVSAAAFLYTTYLAPFLFITHGLYCLIYLKDWTRKWVIGIFLIGITFVPWIPSFLEQLSIGSGLRISLPGWSEVVSAPLLKSLPLVIAKFLIGRITIDNKFLYGAVLLVFSVFFILALIKLYAKNNKLLLNKLFLLFCFPIVTAYLVSFVLPVLAPQRILFTLPYFCALIAMSVIFLKKSNYLLFSFVILIQVYSIFLYNTNTRFQREQWRQAVKFVEADRTSESLAVFAFPDAFAPWLWYSADLVKYIAVAPHFVVNQADITQLKSQLVQSNRIYYFHYLTDLTDPAHLIPLNLKKFGYSETRIVDFPGVGFISIYERALAYH